jgi:hypothetical protein
MVLRPVQVVLPILPEQPLYSIWMPETLYKVLLIVAFSPDLLANEVHVMLLAPLVPDAKVLEPLSDVLMKFSNVNFGCVYADAAETTTALSAATANRARPMTLMRFIECLLLY